MRYLDLNIFREVQVRLAELGLYEGRIDGAFGEGSRTALFTLFSRYAERVGGEVISPPYKTDEDACGLTYFLQVNLKNYNFYLGKTDMIWGVNTSQAFKDFLDEYCMNFDLPLYSAAWSKLVSVEFVEKIREWVKRVELPTDAVDWAMACMYFESGGTFLPNKQNEGGSNAWGLLQFMSGAAKDLKIPLEEIKSMTQLEQLERCVFPYWEINMKRYGKFERLDDMYFAVLRPKSIGSKPDNILFRQGELAYKQNIGLDPVPRKGYILAGQVSATIYSRYYPGMAPKNRRLR